MIKLVQFIPSPSLLLKNSHSGPGLLYLIQDGVSQEKAVQLELALQLVMKKVSFVSV